MDPPRSLKARIATPFIYTQDNYPLTYTMILLLIFLALDTGATIKLVDLFPSGLHLYLVLLVLNLAISATVVTFVTHIFSSHPCHSPFCTPLALVPVLAINIPFSIMSFPDIVGPV